MSFNQDADSMNEWGIQVTIEINIDYWIYEALNFWV